MADGDGKLVFQRAVADDLDKILILQQRAFPQDGVGDLDVVIGQQTDEVPGRVRKLGKLFGDDPADGHFGASDHLVQDVEHQVPLPLGSPKSGSATLEPEQVSQLLAGLWYINIHSTHSPGGEIRGQVLAVPEPATLLLLALGSGALVVLRKRSQA